MARQIDVKALISHIVRGDGDDKCRICLGDTSEGQVYLGDTVMMDEDRAVTLSDLLEVITGVEVPMDGVLPPGLCKDCFQGTMSAISFRNFCLEAANRWLTTVSLLDTLPEETTKDSIYAFIQGNEITIINQDKPKEETTEIEIDFDDDIKTDPIIKPCMYQCPECYKQFVYPAQLHIHLLNTPEDKQACFICGVILPRKKSIMHIHSYHNARFFSCNKCPAVVASSKQLQRHLKEHGYGTYSCVTCERSFKSMRAYNGHLIKHSVRKCPNCEQCFLNHKCYLYHVKNCCNLDLTRPEARRTKTGVVFEINKENKKIKVGSRGSTSSECYCDYCGKKYAGKKFVAAHIQIVHMKNTHTACPYCGKFYAAAHMTEHIKRHEGMPTFTCDFCGIILKTRLGYTQHRRLHSGEKPYKCSYCPETFSASSRRSEHVRKVHKRSEVMNLRHRCTQCPAKFRLPYLLRNHMENVHTLGEKNEFDCPDCHIKFSSFRGLLHHTRKHQSGVIKDVNEEAKDS